MKEHKSIPTKEYLIELISSGRVEEVIEESLDRVKFMISTSDSDQYIDIFKGILMLSRRMRDNKQNQIMGIYPNQEIQIEKNNITASLIDWIGYLPQDYWTFNPSHIFDFNVENKYPSHTRFPFPFSKKRKLFVYKFRAECEHDVNELRRILKYNFYSLTKIIHPYLPDTIVEIATSLTLQELQTIIREINEGRVMLQTIALKENYTGERDYGLH
jgi:hypothetical protein